MNESTKNELEKIKKRHLVRIGAFGAGDPFTEDDWHEMRKDLDTLLIVLKTWEPAATDAALATLHLSLETLKEIEAMARARGTAIETLLLTGIYFLSLQTRINLADLPFPPVDADRMRVDVKANVIGKLMGAARAAGRNPISIVDDLLEEGLARLQAH